MLVHATNYCRTHDQFNYPDKEDYCAENEGKALFSKIWAECVLPHVKKVLLAGMVVAILNILSSKHSCCATWSLSSLAFFILIILL